MIDRDRALELLDYNYETGRLAWRVDRPNGCRAGMTAGSKTQKGAIEVRIDRRPYQAHRLIWLMVYGHWPASFIDHANGDPSDNRLSNLRLATVSQNAANKRRPANNTSGLKGVCWNRKSGKWQAGIKVSGRSIHLGLFANAEDAHRAYQEAAVRHFGEFSRVA